VIVEGTPRALHPSVRDELYRIGREALVNAFLHARASLVELELEYGKRAMRLLVRDDGGGVDPGVLRVGRDGHYGLSGMRERAERIGGRLRLWSAPGAGTEVELVVRSALAQSPAGARRWGWLGRLASSRSGASSQGAPRVENGGR
jgi:signal transduction histidine kinase